MAKSKPIVLKLTLPQLVALEAMVSNSWHSMDEGERKQLLEEASATIRDGAAVAKKVSTAYYVAHNWPKEAYE